ncbi:MAG: ribosome silencing factor [Planctomycetia bacterium]|nr:ribosome silencing factor [Planctomycetia bacterium]
MAKVIEETRGRDIRILDLRKVTEVFDYFVLATGSSRRQMHAVSDEIERVIKDDWGDLKRGIEGYDESHWIVLDYGDVVVHLFDAQARDYWDLEQLWSDAEHCRLRPMRSQGFLSRYGKLPIRSSATTPQHWRCHWPNGSG